MVILTKELIKRLILDDKEREAELLSEEIEEFLESRGEK